MADIIGSMVKPLGALAAPVTGGASLIPGFAQDAAKGNLTPGGVASSFTKAATGGVVDPEAIAKDPGKGLAAGAINTAGAAASALTAGGAAPAVEVGKQAAMGAAKGAAKAAVNDGDVGMGAAMGGGMGATSGAAGVAGDVMAGGGDAGGIIGGTEAGQMQAPIGPDAGPGFEASGEEIMDMNQQAIDSGLGLGAPSGPDVMPHAVGALPAAAGMAAAGGGAFAGPPAPAMTGTMDPVTAPPMSSSPPLGGPDAGAPMASAGGPMPPEALPPEPMMGPPEPMMGAPEPMGAPPPDPGMQYDMAEAHGADPMQLGHMGGGPDQGYDPYSSVSGPEAPPPPDDGFFSNMGPREYMQGVGMLGGIGKSIYDMANRPERPPPRGHRTGMTRNF